MTPDQQQQDTQTHVDLVVFHYYVGKHNDTIIGQTQNHQGFESISIQEN